MINRIKILQSGFCTHPENIVVRGSRKEISKFPAIFALIEHSKYGNILFDTGYSERFFIETAKFPFNIYSKLTPVFLKQEESAKRVLEMEGIDSSDINYIIISHFHADHIGGLKDFKNARFIYNSLAFEKLKNKRGLRALIKGFLPRFIPNDFEEKSLIIDDNMKINVCEDLNPITNGYDLFGDKSIILVELPGHARGQIGALITDIQNNQYFFVADAAWRSKSYKENIPPEKIANIIMDNWKDYIKTLLAIHEIHKNKPKIKIIPSHCIEVIEGESDG